MFSNIEDGPTATRPSITVTTVAFMPQAHIEFSAEVDDFSRSGDHSKGRSSFVADFKFRLAGRECDEPFVLAVLNRDRTVRIQVKD